MKKQRQRKPEEDTELVPPSDPGCSYDEDIPVPALTMMSPRGERNAKQAGNVVNWRTSTIRRQP